MTDVSAKNDGWEPDIVVEGTIVPSRAERLQQIQAKRASDVESRSRHRMFSGRSDDESDIDFLLEVIGVMQGEMAELAGALEQSERQMTAMRAEVSSGAFVPISEWNITIAERDRLKATIDAYRSEPKDHEVEIVTSHLKKQCVRYTNGGFCSTAACMRRGGWSRGMAVDYSMATCEDHEAVEFIRRLSQSVWQKEPTP